MAASSYRMRVGIQPVSRCPRIAEAEVKRQTMEPLPPLAYLVIAEVDRLEMRNDDTYREEAKALHVVGREVEVNKFMALVGKVASQPSKVACLCASWPGMFGNRCIP